MTRDGGNFLLKEEIRDYWSSRAAGFDLSASHRIEDRFGMPEWHRFLRGALGLGRDGLTGYEVLDIACGTGEISRVLTTLGARVTGLDFSEAMLERARAKLAGRDWRFVQADAEMMAPLADASFDVAVTRHLAWTLTDPAAAYREWRRVLRPGGRLLVVDGNFRARRGLGLRLRHWLADRIDRQPGAIETTDRTTHDAIVDRLPYGSGLDAVLLAAELRAAGFEDIRECSIARLYGAGMRGHSLAERLRQSAGRRFALVARHP